MQRGSHTKTDDDGRCEIGLCNRNTSMDVAFWLFRHVSGDAAVVWLKRMAARSKFHTNYPIWEHFNIRAHRYVQMTA